MRAAVIGAGIVGCSVALELARRGWKVSVFEREKAAGRGSTGRSSSVIRCHYTQPEAIMLALEGRHVWQGWARFTGLGAPRAKYHPVGVLFLLQRHPARKGNDKPQALGIKSEVSPEDVSSRFMWMNRLGVETLLLEPEELAKQFPFLRVGAREPVVGLFEPDSGYVAYPQEAVDDLVEAGRRAGVAYRFGAPVRKIETAWRNGRRFVKAVVARRREHFDAAVNCAGPDSARVNLLAQCPLPLTTAPLRQYIVEAVWSNPPWVRVPAMADLHHGFYVRPDRDEFKVGAVLPRHHCDFEEKHDPARAREMQSELLSGLARRLPHVRLQRVRTRLAFYDWTVSDSYPIIDRTDVDGFYAAIGTSGAWFKSGPVIGELMAEIVDSGRPLDSVTLRRTGHKLDLKAFARSRA